MSGWTLKRIQYEAHKRAWAGYEDPSTYHPLRDGKREQEWEWVVDRLFRRMEITAAQRDAASTLYEAEQTLRGDAAPDPRGMRLVAVDGESRDERAKRISTDANIYVQSHPDMNPLRLATFLRLFAHDKPTLETLRLEAKPPGSTTRGRMNQGEVILRVKWCVQVLANHFDGQGYEEAAVNEKQMGVGEGWKLAEFHTDSMVKALEDQGLQTFVTPRGRVYYRNPHEASVFEPLDSTPQIAASKP